MGVGRTPGSGFGVPGLEPLSSPVAVRALPLVPPVPTGRTRQGAPLRYPSGRLSRPAMPRLLLAACVALSLAACGGAPQPLDDGPATPASLAGTYTAEHTVGIFDGEDFAPTDVTDTITLVPRGERLRVAFDLVATNAHLCSFDGEMEARAGGWVHRSELTLDVHDGVVCELGLEVTPDTLRLTDLDGQCRRELCGARATIDGTAFARATQTPDTTVAEPR